MALAHMPRYESPPRAFFSRARLCDALVRLAFILTPADVSSSSRSTAEHAPAQRGTPNLPHEFHRGQTRVNVQP